MSDLPPLCGSDIARLVRFQHDRLSLQLAPAHAQRKKVGMVRVAMGKISSAVAAGMILIAAPQAVGRAEQSARSEEHTSELQSRFDLVCRLLLEKPGHHPHLPSFPTRRSSDLYRASGTISA